MKLTWKDAGLALGKFAPLAGGILGGPIGAGIGEVGSLVAKALGVDATPDAVMEAVKKDPEAGAKIAQVEADKAARLAQIASDQAVARHHEDVADRGSARDRQVKSGSQTPDYLTWLIVIGFILVMLGMVQGYMNEALKNTVIVGFVGVMIRDLGHALHQALTFQFGSVSDDNNTEGK